VTAFSQNFLDDSLHSCELPRLEPSLDSVTQNHSLGTPWDFSDRVLPPCDCGEQVRNWGRGFGDTQGWLYRRLCSPFPRIKLV
jgi:hypothetical protein